MSAHLFVYGTLVEPTRLDAVLGHVHQGERLRAQLSGFARHTRADYDYAFLVPAATGLVEGVIVLDLQPADWPRLDAYEDVDAGYYSRELVSVETWGCGPRPCNLSAYTYVAGPNLKRGLEG